MNAIVEIDQLPADRARSERLQQPPKSTAELFRQVDRATLRRRNAKVRQLIQTWLNDESGYEEETWPLLKRRLNRNRAGGQRKLYDD